MAPWLYLFGFQIPTFMLVESLNACVVLFYIAHRAKKFNIEPRDALDIGLIALVSGLVGARLFHVVWEAPDFYSAHPIQILNLLSGGFVYFGGFFLGFLVSYIVLRIRKEDVVEWLDLIAPVLCLGTALGRVGCLLAGCCYGKVCALPWAITIIDENGLKFPRHPAPLYAIIWELLIFAFLIAIDRVPREERLENLQPAGSLFFTWMILHGAGRFMLEFIRDDFRGISIAGFSISQIIAIVLVSIGAVYMGRTKSNGAA